MLDRIDFPGGDLERTASELKEVIGLDCTNAFLVSAAAGIGIDEFLGAVIRRTPLSSNNEKAPLLALISGLYYDPYLGVVVYFRVADG